MASVTFAHLATLIRVELAKIVRPQEFCGIALSFERFLRLRIA